MAKVREVLRHVTVEVAKRQRVCHRNRAKHQVAAGQKCLVITDENGSGKNYCIECAKAILDQAESDLTSFRAVLSSVG